MGESRVWLKREGIFRVPNGWLKILYLLVGVSNRFSRSHSRDLQTRLNIEEEVISEDEGEGRLGRVAGGE